MNKKQAYYQDNSKEFFDSTVNADVTSLYSHFIKYIPVHGKILDLGCGSGRDAKAFIDMGYNVEAVDGSKELCELASRHAGIDVKCMDFSSIDYENRYDGIWACASLLHVESKELPSMIARLCKAVRPEGIVYMSFKYGDFEGMRDGRFFLDMSEKKFGLLLEKMPEIKLIEEWQSSDVRRFKAVEWYNAIVCRK